MDTVFNINGTDYRTEGWSSKIPSKGDIFRIRVYQGKPCDSDNWIYGVFEEWIVDRIVYEPYVNQQNRFDFSYSDCKVYLEPLKKTEQNPKNID